jgi:hypothetical protein
MVSSQVAVEDGEEERASEGVPGDPGPQQQHDAYGGDHGEPPPSASASLAAA